MKRTTGHLAEKNGKWYAVINLYVEGKRKEKRRRRPPRRVDLLHLRSKFVEKSNVKIFKHHFTILQLSL